MAHIRVQDFAAACGVDDSYIRVYKSRGKVIVEKSGLIDEDNPINVLFKESRLKKKKGNKKPVKREKPKPEEQQEEVKQEPKVVQRKPVTTDEAMSLHELEKQLKALDVQKRAEEVEKLRKQNAKLDGETIPTEMAAQVVSQLSQSFVMAMKIMLDKTLLEWSKRKKFTGEEVALLRRHMVDELNRASQTAVKDSRKSMKVLVEKYSIKRGVGERA